jgi:glyoxylase-like metal-dependent hydrolase (beta-lactamase superfamily II)
MQLGNFTLHLIHAGLTQADAGGPFGLVPRALFKSYYMPDENNLVPMSLNCLFIQTPTQKILIDTGLGSKLDEKGLANWGLTYPHGTLLDGLGRIGVAPSDIDLVINTHLHADHCGGNTMFADTGGVIATFPNAEYVVQAREMLDATHPNERTRSTYIPQNWDVLRARGKLRLLYGDTQLADGIWGMLAPGHTPGLMAIRIESMGQHAAFVCDMASFAVHFEKLAWMTAYDVEPMVTLETKRIWQAWAFDTDAVIIFPHETKRPMGKLIRNAKNQPEIVAIDEMWA